MVRIGIACEGATEREFVNEVLQPYFVATHSASVTGIDMRGNISVERICNDLRKLVHSFDIVSTLVDFYGFRNVGNDDIQTLEGKLSNCISEDKRRFFLPYVQQYEFEALVFSCTEKIVTEFPEVTLESIENIISECGGCEEINNHRDTAPSKRLIGLCEGYDKKLHGPSICSSGGLAKIRSACPRFDAWVTRMEDLIVEHRA